MGRDVAELGREDGFHFVVEERVGVHVREKILMPSATDYFNDGVSPYVNTERLQCIRSPLGN